MARCPSSPSYQDSLGLRCHGCYLLRLILSRANVTDFCRAKPLLKRHPKAVVFSIIDTRYDSDFIRGFVHQRGGIVIISSKAGHAIKPDFDERLSGERHRIENLCARPKFYRRIATRYAKLRITFSGMVSLAGILVWLEGRPVFPRHGLSVHTESEPRRHRDHRGGGWWPTDHTQHTE